MLGKIVIIRKDGTKGVPFPVNDQELTFGRALGCEIRIQLQSVAPQHAKILFQGSQASLENLAPHGTKVNGELLQNIGESRILAGGEMITIGERSFMFEYPSTVMTDIATSSAVKAKTPKKASALGKSPRVSSARKSISKPTKFVPSAVAQNLLAEEEEKKGKLKAPEADDEARVTTPVPMESTAPSQESLLFSPRKTPITAEKVQRIGKIKTPDILSPRKYRQEKSAFLDLSESEPVNALSDPLSPTCAAKTPRSSRKPMIADLQRVKSLTAEFDNLASTKTTNRSLLSFPQSPKTAAMLRNLDTFAVTAKPKTANVSQSTHCTPKKSNTTLLKRNVKSASAKKVVTARDILDSPAKRLKEAATFPDQEMAINPSFCPSSPKATTSTKSSATSSLKAVQLTSYSPLPVASPKLAPQSPLARRQQLNASPLSLKCAGPSTPVRGMKQLSSTTAQPVSKFRNDLASPNLRRKLTFTPDRSNNQPASLGAPLQPLSPSVSALVDQMNRRANPSGSSVPNETPSDQHVNETSAPGGPVPLEHRSSSNDTTILSMCSFEEPVLNSPARKAVSFGPPLSPEIFDYKRPPDSPLRRGTPSRRKSVASTFESSQSPSCDKGKAPDSILLKSLLRKNVKLLNDEMPDLSQQSVLSMTETAANSSFHEPSMSMEWTMSQESMLVMDASQTSNITVLHCDATPTSAQEKMSLPENATSFVGVRELLKTPSGAQEPSMVGIREMLKTPAVKQDDVLVGVRETLRTPSKPNELVFIGLRDMLKTPAQKESASLVGVREMMQTPKVPKEPRMAGLREMMQTPATQDSVNLSGVRNMFKTPQIGNEPVLTGVQEMLKTPGTARVECMAEMREMLKTPKVLVEPEKTGVSEMIQTSGVQDSSPGIREMMKTPNVELTMLDEIVQTPIKHETNAAELQQTFTTPSPIKDNRTVLDESESSSQARSIIKIERGKMNPGSGTGVPETSSMNTDFAHPTMENAMAAHASTGKKTRVQAAKTGSTPSVQVKSTQCNPSMSAPRPADHLLFSPRRATARQRRASVGASNMTVRKLHLVRPQSPTRPNPTKAVVRDTPLNFNKVKDDNPFECDFVINAQDALVCENEPSASVHVHDAVPVEEAISMVVNQLEMFEPEKQPGDSDPMIVLPQETIPDTTIVQESVAPPELERPEKRMSLKLDQPSPKKAPTERKTPAQSSSRRGRPRKQHVEPEQAIPSTVTEPVLNETTILKDEHTKPATRRGRPRKITKKTDSLQNIEAPTTENAPNSNLREDAHCEPSESNATADVDCHVHAKKLDQARRRGRPKKQPNVEVAKEHVRPVQHGGKLRKEEAVEEERPVQRRDRTRKQPANKEVVSKDEPSAAESTVIQEASEEPDAVAPRRRRAQKQSTVEDALKVEEQVDEGIATRPSRTKKQPEPSRRRGRTKQEPKDENDERHSAEQEQSTVKRRGRPKKVAQVQNEADSSENVEDNSNTVKVTKRTKMETALNQPPLIDEDTEVEVKENKSSKSVSRATKKTSSRKRELVVVEPVSTRSLRRRIK